ncbi:5002_t:CDS:2 [Ambispora leptoticha]|uniref:5002_t:CDS:1 n=1 Tax=Ambispora leptoticha TaxID=144679 RepID=A0A9N9HQK5_9GLOM|nr:5002_t:CDS:2 [Ambispora leptoticha]
MQRPEKDPISPHANRLVAYMNGHPNTILAYAKYFGKEMNATSARMTGIDSTGITVKVTKEEGDEVEIIIQFKQQLTSHEQVRGVLTEMAKEAEDALNLPSTRPPSPPPTTNNIHTPFIWPHPLHIFSVLAFLIIIYTPDYLTPEPLLLLHEHTNNLLRSVQWPVFFLHLFGTSTVVWILAKKGESDLKTWFMWVGFTMLLGGSVAKNLWIEKEKNE